MGWVCDPPHEEFFLMMRLCLDVQVTIMLEMEELDAAIAQRDKAAKELGQCPTPCSTSPSYRAERK